MPYRAYTDAQRTEAMEVITQHPDNLLAARIELAQRWGHAPAPSTLTMWIADAQGQNTGSKGITSLEWEHSQNGTWKRFEGTETGTPWQKLMEAVAGLSNDPECTVIIIARGLPMTVPSKD